jgi:hypothetical protein
MRITLKTSKIVSLSVFVVVVGALLYFGFRSAALHPVMPHLNRRSLRRSLAPPRCVIHMRTSLIV